MRRFAIVFVFFALFAFAAFAQTETQAEAGEAVIRPSAAQLASWSKKYFENKDKLATLQASIEQLKQVPPQEQAPAGGSAVDAVVDERTVLEAKAAKLNDKIMQLEAALKRENVDLVAAETEYKRLVELKAFKVAKQAELKQQLDEIKVQMKTGTLSLEEKQQLKIKKTELKLAAEKAVLEAMNANKAPNAQ